MGTFRTRRATLRGMGAGSEQPPGETKPGTSKFLLVLTIIIAVAVAGFVIYLPNLTNFTVNGGTHSSTATDLSVLNSTSTSSTATVATLSLAYPLIQNGGANVSYPTDYQTLAGYALNVINQDRGKFGLGGVTLSPIPSAQQHADSMLYFGYFSHFDTQGYKPYMRYTLLGGVGAVEENIAFISWESTYYTGINNVEKSISDLEYSMMYNDSACCSDGHRDNILSPLHNRVSIGVAYNSTALFFVEDFENYYINLQLTLVGSSVSIQGTPVNLSQKSSEMAVFYDPIPTSENVSALNNSPHEYDPGTLVGGVFPPCPVVCPYSQTGVTVYASHWEYTPTEVSLSFSLSQFVQRFGPGVYTLYLLAGGNTNTTVDNALTSISIFQE